MSMQTHACNCIGPQNGQPLCPCMMRGVIQRDGRWIQPERDLGPVLWIGKIFDFEAKSEWTDLSDPKERERLRNDRSD